MVQVPLFMLCRSVVSGEVLDCLIDGRHIMPIGHT